jgi:hypothetical protein
VLHTEEAISIEPQIALIGILEQCLIKEGDRRVNASPTNDKWQGVCHASRLAPCICHLPILASMPRTLVRSLASMPNLDYGP